jgi:hypothetical protein
VIRRAYHLLIHIHPAQFRDRFGDEMLSIFDEVAGTPGATALLGDACFSLLRQWAVRSGAWKIVVAALITLIEFAFVVIEP